MIRIAFESAVLLTLFTFSVCSALGQSGLYPTSVTGSIVSIDAASHKIAIKTAGSYFAPMPNNTRSFRTFNDVPLVVSVNATTVLTLNGRRVSLRDLAAGLKVTVKYSAVSLRKGGTEINTGESLALQINASR